MNKTVLFATSLLLVSIQFGCSSTSNDETENDSSEAMEMSLQEKPEESVIDEDDQKEEEEVASISIDDLNNILIKKIKESN